MKRIKLSRAFTLIEPGPVTLVATHDGQKANVMTITWTMVLDFQGGSPSRPAHGTIPSKRCARRVSAWWPSPRST